MELSKILKEELKVSYLKADSDQEVLIESGFEYFCLILHTYFLQQGFLCNGMLNQEKTDDFIINLKPFDQKWKAKGLDLIVFNYENDISAKFEKKSN